MNHLGGPERLSSATSETPVNVRTHAAPQQLGRQELVVRGHAAVAAGEVTPTAC